MGSPSIGRSTLQFVNLNFFCFIRIYYVRESNAPEHGEPLRQVCRVGRQPGPAGDEGEEEHPLLLRQRGQDLPQPGGGRLGRVEVPGGRREKLMHFRWEFVSWHDDFK